MAPYSVIKEKNLANVSTDRVIKLIPGYRGAINSKGVPQFNLRLYTNSELHAKQDNGLWHLQMITISTGKGMALPEVLNQRWTNFNQMMKFLEGYFAARNVQIEEVIS